ncbi:GntR family transcriptional regulator [Neorhizobium galegae]|uniref:GntR family transcriptional regulator n=1 Tax=Neorhizobium galegae TaxID=399 RepID=UPI000622007A|nr:GntR family transcriptional regulator [Neorhizobium galegae]CDZ64582.1 KorSA, regulatory protein [Neorhizobium galegae bv. orientalis]KAB1119967.1 GntR family transcriptional regulator [Neorhizobium galegae]MCQ1575287.1 GntR family transcriptional regulator [Neorhizobium galegae]MCQ1808954.1 GntR family transcriptional regulator [Neorhizobium galegae]MCQ1838731.1 GntR family transcriptional regulator [Neorhizobium galegae]
MNTLQLGASSTSLHERVREELLRRVKNGIYAPGDSIPSTASLSEEFGVSAITVKRALRDLQAAGALSAVPGKGTFVKDQRRFLRELDVWMSSMDNARGLGFKPTMELVSITREKIIDSTMSVFSPPEEAMMCVRKTIFADGSPIMYDATYLSSDVSDDIVEEFGERFVTDALERHSIVILNTRLIVDAAPAMGKAEDVFGIPSGYPMLRRLYKITTSDPGVTVFGVVVSPFDRLACSINLPGDVT